MGKYKFDSLFYLVDHLVVYPKGVIEDVLVKVDHFPSRFCNFNHGGR